MKPRAYEMMPYGMFLPAIPRLSDDPLPVDQIRTSGGFSIAGARTVECTAEGAKREAEEMLKVCRARVNRGEPWALTELLDANPAFIGDSWVRRTFGQLIEQGVPLRWGTVRSVPPDSNGRAQISCREELSGPRAR